jgi:hypothetical protein
MKTIKLTQNKFSLVDDDDFEWLNKLKWTIHSKGYAISRLNGKVVYMHRLINKTLNNFETDHINRNKLDNRKENLRNITSSKNKINTGLWKHNTSGYKGVSWVKRDKKWKVQIQVNKKSIHLGLCNNIEEAFFIRKQAELNYYGE